jgi:hypothetical protein
LCLPPGGVVPGTLCESPFVISYGDLCDRINGYMGHKSARHYVGGRESPRDSALEVRNEGGLGLGGGYITGLGGGVCVQEGEQMRYLGGKR